MVHGILGTAAAPHPSSHCVAYTCADPLAVLILYIHTDLRRPAASSDEYPGWIRRASRISFARLISGGEEDRDWRVRVKPKMIRRVAGQLLEAVGGRGVGLGRGRLAQLLPPVVVGLQSSVMTPRDGDGKRWGGALLRRRDEVEG
jgi:hypothetical protein